MKFGAVQNPGEIHFYLPQDHLITSQSLSKDLGKGNTDLRVYVGCAKWNKNDLKNFYPKGTKDELGYYAQQFNCIEFNASFYRLFAPQQFEAWRQKTPDHFRFFTKIGQEISHWKRLEGTEQAVDLYIHSISSLEHKLGGVFLQMHQNFSPQNWERLQAFIAYWPKAYPLAVELRHSGWYDDPVVLNELLESFSAHGIQHIITDCAGRRDLLHMALTTKRAFIRYVGTNHHSDYSRLDEWVERIVEWKQQGLEELDFFVHQNTEKESPVLSAYFIRKLNETLGLTIQPPVLPSDGLLF